MAEKQTEPGVFEVPENFDRIQLQAEFKNYLQKLKDGKNLNKADRLRLLQLRRILSGKPNWSATFTDSAEEAGAYREGVQPGKTSKVEMLKRVSLVAEWIVRSFTRPEIIRESAILWGVGYSTADAYVKRANDMIAKRAMRGLEARYGKLAEKYELVFRTAMDAGEIGCARDVLDSMAKLDGLQKPVTQRYEFSGPDGQTLGIINGPAKDPLPAEPDSSQPLPPSP